MGKVDTCSRMFFLHDFHKIQFNYLSWLWCMISKLKIFINLLTLRLRSEFLSSLFGTLSSSFWFGSHVGRGGEKGHLTP